MVLLSDACCYDRYFNLNDETTANGWSVAILDSSLFYLTSS